MPGTIPGTIDAPPDLTPSAPPEAPDLPAGPPKPDTPPKRPTTRAGRAAAAAARKAANKAPREDKAPKGSKVPRRASLETRLTGSLTTLGTMVAAAGAMTTPAVQLDGVAIIQHAPSIAAALDKVAKDDPRVAQALERMLTAGVWSGLIAAMLPLVLAIAANHGAIPESIAAMLGATPADPTPPAPAGPAGSVPVV
jgi:hypothetical protein